MAKVRMSRDALRIYNMNRRKRGLPILTDDDTDTTDAQTAFQETVDEVTPYTTGLQTNTDDEDYAKNIKNELDWISNSTQYLFNAVDAAQDTWDQAQQAAGDAADAQASANAAQQTADDAYDKALANAQDIVTIQGDITGINTTIGTMQVDIANNTADITGLQTDVTNAGATASEALSVAQGVDDEYTAQWGVKTTVGSLQGGVGFFNNGTTTLFCINAKDFIMTDGSSTVVPFAVSDGKVYAQNIVISGSDSSGSIEITNTQIIVKDGSGATKVIIGKLS